MSIVIIVAWRLSNKIDIDFNFLHFGVKAVFIAIIIVITMTEMIKFLAMMIMIMTSQVKITTKLTTLL